MSSRNIQQVADFSQLKQIVMSNMTVIIGMTCDSTPTASKYMIKRFLKRKSEMFPLIQFVYMDLSSAQVAKANLSIVSNDIDEYPIVHHIRDGNNIVCTVPCASEQDVYDSFDELAVYYKKEMKEFQKKVKQARTGQIQEDSESEIEIERNFSSDSSSKAKSKKSKKFNKIKSPNVVMEGQDQNRNDQNRNDQESRNENDPNDMSELTPQMKAALQRQKLKVLERKYGDLQKDLFEEIKVRMKLEKEEAQEEEDKTKKDKTKKSSKALSKAGNVGNAGNAGKSEPKPIVQHDQIGQIKTKSKSKSRGGKPTQTKRRRE